MSSVAKEVVQKVDSKIVEVSHEVMSMMSKYEIFLSCSMVMFAFVFSVVVIFGRDAKHDKAWAWLVFVTSILCILMLVKKLLASCKDLKNMYR